ncbi:MAG TPA: glutamate racemase [Gammaproteobacteria bacterium]|nr:glutamate racemase [Gammaproteobacteria bacterium]
MLQSSTHPIGIFDSGMGGLTVAKTITEYLPDENIVYFGDTAHTPWGDKSTAAIQAYAIKICDVLLQHQCKLIVIACHTASTAAYELIAEYVGNKAFVINVVDPVIKHVQQHHTNKKIGLIGTKQTIRSNTYKRRVDRLGQNIELASLATPLLVPLIEEGFGERHVTTTIMQEYLAHPNLENIEALILGCTHYPLLKPMIQNFYKNKVDIIDASEMTAKILKEHLTLHNLLNPGTNSKETTLNDSSSKRTFYVSDHNEFFETIAKLFFPGKIELKHYPLWE